MVSQQRLQLLRPRAARAELLFARAIELREVTEDQATGSVIPAATRVRKARDEVLAERRMIREEAPVVSVHLRELRLRFEGSPVTLAVQAIEALMALPSKPAEFSNSNEVISVNVQRRVGVVMRASAAVAEAVVGPNLALAQAAAVVALLDAVVLGVKVG